MYFVRATHPVAVELHQPVASGESVAPAKHITARVLGAMHVDDQVHHYRVVGGDGVLFLVPPEWIELRLTVETQSEPLRAEVLA